MEGVALIFIVFSVHVYTSAYTPNEIILLLKFSLGLPSAMVDELIVFDTLVLEGKEFN